MYIKDGVFTSSHSCSPVQQQTHPANMKVAVFLLCLVAVAVAAPQKRLFIDTITGDAAKIAECELKLNKDACVSCCREQSWTVSLEVHACTAACNLLG